MSIIIPFPNPEADILSCRALIGNEHGELLVLQRAAGYSQAGKWEFPGGGIQDDETPFEAIVREIDEETGLAVEFVDHQMVEFERRRIKGGKHAGETIASMGIVATAASSSVTVSEEHPTYHWGRPSELFRQFDLTPTTINAFLKFGRAISRL